MCSCGESDGLSLPEKTRKGKKSSGQQKTPLQTNESELAQLPAGDPSTPATNPATRTESMIAQTTELAQTPAIHAGMSSRTGSPHVVLHDIHSLISKISLMPGPLFTEDCKGTSWGDTWFSLSGG